MQFTATTRGVGGCSLIITINKEVVKAFDIKISDQVIFEVVKIIKKPTKFDEVKIDA